MKLKANRRRKWYVPYPRDFVRIRNKGFVYQAGESMRGNNVEVIIDDGPTPIAVEKVNVPGADVDVQYGAVLAGALTSTPDSS